MTLRISVSIPSNRGTNSHNKFPTQETMLRLMFQSPQIGALIPTSMKGLKARLSEESFNPLKSGH